MSRSGRYNQPANYFPPFGNPPNSSSCFPEHLIGATEITGLCMKNFETGFQELIRFWDDFELQNVDMKHRKMVHRNQKAYSFCGGKHFGLIKACTSQTDPLKERTKFLSTYYNGLGHWDLGRTKLFITDGFWCLTVTRMFESLPKALTPIKSSF